MKKTILLLICLVAGLGTLHAQSAPEKQVLAAIEVWKNAVLTKNEAALKGVLADDLSYGHSNGLIENKAEFMEVILKEKTKFTTLDMPDMQVNIVGNTAVVRNKMFADVETAGVKSRTNLGVLQVWTRGRNGWQLLARQGFKL
jgi:ketosteroid isomerase-like protein